MRHITIAAYSPMGVSRCFAEILAGYFPSEWGVLDFTDAGVRKENHFFDQQDFIIFAAPSLMGRLPVVEGGIFDHIYANDTPGVFLATFTGQTYGDMLLELAQTAEDRGVVGIGAAAFPVPQNTGKIDDMVAEESAGLRSFAKVMDRIFREMELTPDYIDGHALKVRGHFPYRHYEEFDARPRQAGGTSEYFYMRPSKLHSLSRTLAK